MLEVLVVNESYYKEELYRGVKSAFFIDNRPHYTAFYSRHSDGLSVDWSRFSTCIESWERLDESYTCLASLSIEFVLKGIKEDFPEANLSIKHAPIENNPSHCLILGKITQGIAKKISRICSIYKPY